VSRVSIKDIAREADVSHSTVSRALSDSSLVNSVTKSRIRKFATEMGYSPDAQARSLVKGRTLTIGVVVTTIADPFVAEVVQGVETTAQGFGYTVILASSNSVPEREMAAVEMLRSKRVDGIIVTSSRVGALYLEHLERIGAPVVLVNNHREESGPYTLSIGVDNQHGGCLATRHLIEMGHRHIAYVTGSVDHSSNTSRISGYRQALASAGVEADPSYIHVGDGRSETGEAVLPMLLQGKMPPTAVFCYNDMTAIGLMRAARAAGLEIPRDLAVVGFDDIPFARYVEPPLTTIAQPKFEMGQRAVELVVGLLEGHNHTGSNLVLQGQLIVRRSSSLDATNAGDKDRGEPGKGEPLAREIVQPVGDRLGEGPCKL
jgi:DNA-binding LacI/PurR family transcriptional regulator